MVREFLLPELAESVVEGEVVRWIVAEGQSINRDDPMIEVMSDKVTVELPSPYTGILEKHLVKEGDVVPVHTPIARIIEEMAGAGETANATPSAGATQTVGVTLRGRPGLETTEDTGDANSLFQASKPTTEEHVFQIRKSEIAKPQSQKKTGAYGRVLAVPAARRLARELGVDPEQIQGSGENGRVRVEDVKAEVEKRRREEEGKISAPRTLNPVPFKAIDYKTPSGFEELETRLPVRGLRRAISQQMVASHLQSVRTLHVDEADMTGLVKLREKLKPVAEKQNVKLSYLPFIMKAVVAALKAFPMLNASLDESTNEIVCKLYYNLGMAVAMEAGLVVPVLHNVDKKGILELAQTIQDLAAKARDNKLASEDVKGGTFSITNIGSLGGLFSFPIINVPEAAILGVHSIKKRPVVLDDDSIVARQMVYLSLSFDHRIVDGAEAAMFTSYLIEILENPERLMLE
jgi:2-oxoisovalerate dehydrogenase E2 component (dihydrolipoyl transacylase)